MIGLKNINAPVFSLTINTSELFFKPQTRKYFEKLSPKYDREKGIIQIGEEIRDKETAIKVNDQLLCGLDGNYDLKCLYIIPTRFIREVPE